MTGIALAREGLNVTIFEKAREDRKGGAGLQVDGGLFDRSKTAKLLRKLASGGKRSIQHWSFIESRLRNEAQSYAQIDLRYSTRIKSVGQNEDAAWAETDSGELIYGDILIGADGHRSMVRGHIAPHKPNATFSGYLVWFASVKEDNLPEEHRPYDMKPGVTMLNGINNGFFFGSILAKQDDSSVDRRVGCTWYDNTRNDLLRRLGCVKGDVVHHSLKGADIPEGTLQDMAQQAKVKWPQPWSAAALHAIQTRDLTGIPIKEYIPDTLVKGRMALIGDAGHVPAPITASGFNESLQDAADLGKCVAKGIQGNAASEALKKYESMRLNKVQQMVQSGQWFSRSYRQP
nr:NAD(P)/FAD-dependent oxidoreductase [Lentibacillus sp. JNUCC-1]